MADEEYASTGYGEGVQVESVREAGEAAAEQSVSEPIAEPPPAAMAEPPDIPPVNFAQPSPDVDYNPQDEIEELLLAPTDRPEEPVTLGMAAGAIRPPAGLRHLLPLLTEAAAAPDAPQPVHNLLNTILVGLRSQGEI